MQKQIPKEPSKAFFKLFIILFIINSIFSIIVFIISPEQVPSKLTYKGFENYKGKIFVLYPILLQIIFLVMALIFHKIMPAALTVVKIHPNFLQNFFMKGIRLLVRILGINPDNTLDVLITKYISAFFLTASCLLIAMNIINLGFSFEVSNFYNYLIAFMILVVVLIIPVFRFFSKKLQ